MSPPREDWDVPVLDRMREDFRALAERDARSARSRRRRRDRRLRVCVAAAAVLGACLVGVLLVDRQGNQAVADIRDAPRAAERAGSFAYQTVISVRVSDGQRQSRQAGVVDLRARAFADSISGAGTRVTDRIGLGEDLYFRVRATGAGSSIVARERWQRVALGSAVLPEVSNIPATVAPVSNSAIRALARARGEAIVSDTERVSGIRVTHYRLAMDASTFLGLRGAPTEVGLDTVKGDLHVWLDADDLPRRMLVRFRAAGEATRFAIDTRYSRYGVRPQIRPPRRATRASSTPTVTDPVVASMLAAFGAKR